MRGGFGYARLKILLYRLSFFLIPTTFKGSDDFKENFPHFSKCVQPINSVKTSIIKKNVKSRRNFSCLKFIKVDERQEEKGNRLNIFLNKIILLTTCKLGISSMYLFLQMKMYSAESFLGIFYSSNETQKENSFISIKMKLLSFENQTKAPTGNLILRTIDFNLIVSTFEIFLEIVQKKFK